MGVVASRAAAVAVLGSYAVTVVHRVEVAIGSNVVVATEVEDVAEIIIGNRSVNFVGILVTLQLLVTTAIPLLRHTWFIKGLPLPITLAHILGSRTLV